MRDSVQASDGNGGFSFVVNQNGHVVFSPKTEGELQVRWASVAPDLRESDNKELAQLVSDAMEGKTDVRLVELDDGVYYMNGAPMKTLGWTMVSAFSQDVADKPAEMMVGNYQQIQEETAAVYLRKRAVSRTTIMILLFVATGLTLLSGIVLGKKIVTPLNTITKRIAALSGSNLEFKMEDAFRTEDEIEVLAQAFANLSHKTAMYLDEVRSVTAEKERISTELHMANQIQESMLPSIFPAFPERREFDIYATMDPAREVGGDFYDFFLIDEDHLCMVIADVSGKGVPAALFMMISKIIIQSCAMLGRSAGEILTKTNEALCSNNRMEMFVTVWLGILEISTGRITAANAGHEYPVLKKDGRFELFKDRHGLVSGGIDGINYKEYEFRMEPGDKIFVYTDGVAEAMNSEKELFGTDRMLDALNKEPQEKPQQILKNVRDAVDTFVGNSEQFDDLTMLCFEYKGPA